MMPSHARRQTHDRDRSGIQGELRQCYAVSNVYIAPISRVIGVKLGGVGKLRGRVISEALKGGKRARSWRHDIVSPPGDGGLRTIVNMQFVGKTCYSRAAGFLGRKVGLK